MKTGFLKYRSKYLIDELRLSYGICCVCRNNIFIKDTAPVMKSIKYCHYINTKCNLCKTDIILMWIGNLEISSTGMSVHTTFGILNENFLSKT